MCVCMVLYLYMPVYTELAVSKRPIFTNTTTKFYVIVSAMGFNAIVISSEYSHPFRLTV